VCATASNEDSPITQQMDWSHAPAPICSFHERCASLTHVLDLLASGATVEEVLHDHPSLERDDVLAAIAYAAQFMDHAVVRVA